MAAALRELRIQSSAADVLLEALHRVDQALPGTLVAAVHDELVLEVDAAEAERAAQVLEEQMAAAFQRWFPEAPTLGLVDVAVRPCWAKPEGGSSNLVAPLLTAARAPALRAQVLLSSQRPRKAARAESGDQVPTLLVHERPPESGVATFFAYIDERQHIHLRRQAGAPPPWTDDPILRDYRFCCVNREDDRVTRWIRTRWREPYADHPSLAFAMCMARLINNPVVLEALGYPAAWSAARTLRRLQDLEARGVVIWTPSYRRCIPRSGSRLVYCVEILDRLHQDPPPLAQAQTLEAAFDLLKDRPGVGPFVAYEVVTDLRRTPLLRDAPDTMTWANAGPGAIKGLHRVWGRPSDQSLRPEQALSEMRLLLELSPGYLGAHVPSLELRDIEHNLCEIEKYLRVKLGEGTGRPYRPQQGVRTMATEPTRRHLLPAVAEALELEMLEDELRAIEAAETRHAAAVPELEAPTLIDPKSDGVEVEPEPDAR